MEMWRKININKQNIKAHTDKAVLIAMPHNSEFNGFCFWHPSKLVREGEHASAVSISYTEDFVFRLKKYGKGKYNSREVIDEVPLAYDEIEEIFEEMNENIVAPAYKSSYETHKPEEVAAIERTADASLIDDEFTKN